MEKIKTVKRLGNVLILNGEYYEPVSKHEASGQMVFKKINKNEYDKVMKSVVDRLANYLNKKQILRDALSELPLAKLESFEALLKEKKINPKIRQKSGCIELMVGDDIIQIR